MAAVLRLLQLLLALSLSFIAALMSSVSQGAGKCLGLIFRSGVRMSKHSKKKLFNKLILSFMMTFGIKKRQEVSTYEIEHFIASRTNGYSE